MPQIARFGAAALVVVMLMGSGGAAIAQPVVGSGSVPLASRYTVCNFDDPSVPVANTKYPFRFLLTSKIRRSGKANVRKAVRSIQEILRAEGYRGPTGRPTLVDGDYGPATAHAVKQFQRRMGLKVDGKVGPRTWKRLGREYCWMYH